MARKSGASGIVVAALLMGIVTAVMLGSYLRSQADKEKKNWQPVVVAAQDIPARTKINRDMIRIDHFPKELIAEGIFTKPEEVVNRLTKDSINAKAQIRSSDVLAPGEAFTMAYKVHDGMRAVAISVDEVRGVGTSVQPNDHVDIIATFQDQRTRQVTTKMILQNVLVLFVDKGRTDANGQQGASTSVTLEVRPEQTELVKAAERSGTLNVTLRPIQDTAIIPSAGVTERELGGGQPLSEQTPLQPERTSVIIIPPTSSTRQKPEITIIRATTEQTVPQ
jgi:pilus assembly protein CpaB